MATTSTPSLIRALSAALLLFSWLSASGCRAVSGSRSATEVCVLGMTHSGHETSELWGLPQVEAALRALEPDAVLAEIPPDRFGTAAREFADNGSIEEPRVKRFPEYTGVLFPLQAELGFEIVPCAAWTEPMARDRSEKLRLWRSERAEDSARVEAGQASIRTRLADLGTTDDPHLIHTDAYDTIVKEGLLPYDELFNDDLGPGGWTNINAAHWALIEAAIDARPGQRLIITFGGWHKYWFLEQLRERDDVRLLDARDYLPSN